MSYKSGKFEDVLHEKYDANKFVSFVREFFNDVTIIAPDKEQFVPQNFYNYIRTYYHIGNYVDDNRNRIGIFSVCLQKEDNLTNARSMQRNFVIPLIENKCDAAFVAFYSDDDLSKWRISFIRLDYELVKGNVKKKITPAKRYSYLVGSNEPCHTALKRLFPIYDRDDKNPSIDDLEEAFSVEKVTNEFFQQYCEKYHQLREYLESNEDFMQEAQIRNFTSEQFAKKLLGQIVFLYFIQKKGWLGVDAIPVTMTEKEYKNAFFARGQKSRDIIGTVYAKQENGTYKIVFDKLKQLSDADEEFLAGIVKGKRWGTGPKDFMRKLFEGCVDAGKNYFDDYLEPLFYSALNVNRGENGFYPALHRRIPFLNGGLFEQLDNYEWENNDFNIPNEIFSNIDVKGRDADGILDIFDRYNFTMNEDEPMEREVAIDPEMLGKVFENLLDVKDRKSKGAFYTPREIVHYMCQETLINHLVSKTGISESAIRDFILYGEYLRDEDTVKTEKYTGTDGKQHYKIDKEKDLLISEEIFSFKKGVNRLQELDDLLANVKVADLAVGSGAFPLGMLNEIVRARSVLTEYLAIEMNNFQKKSFYAYERKPYDLKVNTIKNCIFACDIEPSAVDIAKLRLWLSIVIDDEITEDMGNGEFDAHNKPRQLPNLDCNIICGNSLIDEFKGVKLITDSELLNNESENKQFTLAQKGVDAMLAKLIELQDKLFFTKEHNDKEEIKADIQRIYDDIILEQLQGSPELTDAYYETVSEPSKPFILWQLYFPRVFRDNGGFDIVIGNPPYVGERKHKEVFDGIQKSTIGRFYLGRMDFFYFFFHLALDLLKKGGHCSLITTNYYTTALGAKKLRYDLKERSTLIEVINFNETKVFDNAAGQHNMITMFVKGKRSEKVRSIITHKEGVLSGEELTQVLKNKDYANYYELIPDEIWDGEECYLRISGMRSTSNPVNAILEKMLKNATDVLGNVCSPLIGLESSLDEVYVIDKNKVQEITGGRIDELKHIKMFFKGSAIHRYSIEEQTDKYILYLHEKISDIQKLNGIWKYLCDHEIEIKGRKGANLRGAYKRGNWWVLNTPRLDMNFEDEKIVTHYRSKTLRFALSTSEWYASRDVYYIVKKKDNIELKYILALLNSSLYYQWFYHRGKRKGDMLELYAKPLKEVPIKEIPLSEQKRYCEIVDDIISLKKRNESTMELENQIDNMVYELYDLTSEEIRLIELYGNEKYGKI